MNGLSSSLQSVGISDNKERINHWSPLLLKVLLDLPIIKVEICLVCIDDDGLVLGLGMDYQTLKHKNRDGFERCIMYIIKKSLGGEVCSLVHCVFYEIKGKDICRIFVEQSKTPIYCKTDNKARYYLRTGNGTRELDARESFAHILKARTI